VFLAFEARRRSILGEYSRLRLRILLGRTFLWVIEARKRLEGQGWVSTVIKNVEY
jgi:hypothetical protein